MDVRFKDTSRWPATAKTRKRPRSFTAKMPIVWGNTRSDHSTFSATRFGRERRLAEIKSALSASSPRSAVRLPKGYGWRCGGGGCIGAAILIWTKSPDMDGRESRNCRDAFRSGPYVGFLHRCSSYRCSPDPCTNADEAGGCGFAPYSPVPLSFSASYRFLPFYRGGPNRTRNRSGRSVGHAAAQVDRSIVTIVCCIKM